MMRRLAVVVFLVTGTPLFAAPATQPSPTTQPATQPSGAAERFGFADSVKLTVTDEWLIVESNGIPNHKTGAFPNPRNPNRILEQRYTFKIPRHPRMAEEISRVPMGPIGVAINGVPFYNPYNAEGNNAVEGPFAEVFDSCCGHPDQLGRYHYHQYPTCFKSPFRDKPGEHSPLIGYAFDGFAIYGPLGEEGKEPGDLDTCNGHSDAARGYHYHVTKKMPYILGGYRGEVSPESFDRRGTFVGGRRPDRPPPRGGGRRGDRPPPEW